MKLSNEEVLQIIRSFDALSEWWEREQGESKGPVTIVEKVDDVTYDDSWRGDASGNQSMVFKFGDEYFKVETYSSSYYGADWDTVDYRDYKLTITNVKPKTRSVSYYE